MTIIYSEDFETDGNGVRYLLPTGEFTDGSGDFYTRTDGSNIGSFYDVSGQSGATRARRFRGIAPRHAAAHAGTGGRASPQCG
ncbi:hypothetical protein [Sinisalibacter aestuarii]|uniref:Uncharacterized protein n=1 Tax=Sinisalibacter aestuarii TaxID=2949426 RepID=A0ABQ5M049_9RHOB|nr:hypothetical protein [Sinisalibacter aestuarii]GKY90141.1 hypothetical protein STA1M1_40100 [Sinisalibacter aestuarii]